MNMTKNLTLLVNSGVGPFYFDGDLWVVGACPGKIDKIRTERPEKIDQDGMGTLGDLRFLPSCLSIDEERFNYV
jgi:hypothetical protein